MESSMVCNLCECNLVSTILLISLLHVSAEITFCRQHSSHYLCISDVNVMVLTFGYKTKGTKTAEESE